MGILERLRDLPLPAPVPVFEHFASRRRDFPWHFAAYRYIDGTPLADIDDKTILDAAAPAIGKFLAVLHRAPVEGDLPSPWDQSVEAAQMKRFTQSLDAYPADLCQSLGSYLEAPWPREPDLPSVLTHADLLEDHILVDPTTGKLAGVIDWADACSAIRCGDFAGLYYVGGKEYAERAYATYLVEPNADEWRWLQHVAITIGVDEVYYGYHDQQPQRLSKGLERIRRHLP